MCDTLRLNSCSYSFWRIVQVRSCHVERAHVFTLQWWRPSTTRRPERDAILTSLTSFPGEAGSCVDVDECASSPCRNAATCENEENAFRCACAAGFEGVTCDVNIDECAAQPCKNGAE